MLKYLMVSWDEGIVPALMTWNFFGAYFLKNASAIWLRPAFSTHTNRIFVVLVTDII